MQGEVYHTLDSLKQVFQPKHWCHWAQISITMEGGGVLFYVLYDV